MCPFCIRYAAETECYGKGTESKQACPASECSKKHAKDLHDLPTNVPSMVNVLECKEDKEEEEGCVNVITGADKVLQREKWRIPDGSLLEMEEEDEEKLFHINVVKEDMKPRDRRAPHPFHNCARRNNDIHQRMNANGLWPYDLFS
jgi:hypothetical protein